MKNTILDLRLRRSGLKLDDLLDDSYLAAPKPEREAGAATLTSRAKSEPLEFERGAAQRLPL